jgi:hypothetical protein
MKTILRRIQKLEWTSAQLALPTDQPRSIELQFICPETKEAVASRVIEVGRCSVPLGRSPLGR